LIRGDASFTETYKNCLFLSTT